LVKNAELTKARILEAAENEFADKGIYGARVDTIAKMAMANKQLIYAYFGSKEQLYIKVLERIYERVTEIDRQFIADPEDPETAFRDIIKKYFEFLSKDTNFVKLVMWENLNEGKYLFASNATDIKDYSIKSIRHILETGMRRGVFRANLDIEETILSMNMFVFSYFSNIYTMSKIMHTDYFKPERILKRADYLTDLLLNSIVDKSEKFNQTEKATSHL